MKAILILLAPLWFTAQPCLASTQNFGAEVARFSEQLRQSASEQTTCAILEQMNQFMLQSIDATLYSLEQTRLEAKQIVRTIADTRIEIHDQLHAWYKAGTLTSECVATIRTSLRVARYLEEYLSINFISGLESSTPFQMNDVATLYGTNVTPAEIHNLLRPGDILLTRGSAFSSAAIARIGAIDSQFSHLSLVGQTSGELITIESWIERGTLIRPYRTGHFLDKHARVVVYRLREEYGTADHAPSRVLALIEDYAAKHGRQIPYDFAMRQDDSSKLYCAEIIRYAFGDMVNQGSVPLFPTNFSPATADFRNQIGVEVDAAFAPADIELDPRFKLIAEWRNFERLHQAHMKDLLLSKFFQWLEADGYRLKPTWTNKAKAFFASLFRRSDLLANWLGIDQRLSYGMQAKTVLTFLALDEALAPIYDFIVASDRAYHTEHARHLTFPEMADLVEKLKIEDHQAWINGKDSLFHQFFSPDQK